MSWLYSQRTGRLTHNGQMVSNGYSGKGIGRNNPQLEQTQNVGPIPRGRYRIGPAHTHPGKGPITMSLAPIGHMAYGRTHFLIHGDSRANPGNASEGCIILQLDVRRRIAASRDRILEVTE